MLETCIDNILSGPWRFVQLRGAPLSTTDINRGDVDLLGSPEAIDALITECFKWVKSGYCHLHVGARKFGKKVLLLYSLDGTRKLHFDLWYSLPQLVGSKTPLTFAAMESHIDYTTGCSIGRFQVDLEACIYLHHLAAKKKDFKIKHNYERLDGYIDTCHELLVLDCLKQARTTARIDEPILNETRSLILNVLDIDKTKLLNDCRKRLRGSQRLLCIMGCDGVGKTSLAQALAEKNLPRAKSFRGKRLYRSSLLYKLMVTIFRPSLEMREQLDEFFAGPIYLRACFGLFLKEITGSSAESVEIFRFR
ncbi:MAG: hypothetical protein C0622_09170 [Desulfuromonas sp.]|nr:MAG: hypothetical protein C0622_09170 [Desulfuromonas sp.]